MAPKATANNIASAIRSIPLKQWDWLLESSAFSETEKSDDWLEQCLKNFQEAFTNPQAFNDWMKANGTKQKFLENLKNDSSTISASDIQKHIRTYYAESDLREALEENPDSEMHLECISSQFQISSQPSSTPRLAAPSSSMQVQQSNIFSPPSPPPPPPPPANANKQKPTTPNRPSIITIAAKGSSVPSKTATTSPPPPSRLPRPNQTPPPPKTPPKKTTSSPAKKTLKSSSPAKSTAKNVASSSKQQQQQPERPKTRSMNRMERKYEASATTISNDPFTPFYGQDFLNKANPEMAVVQFHRTDLETLCAALGIACREGTAMPELLQIIIDHEKKRIRKRYTPPGATAILTEKEFLDQGMKYDQSHNPNFS